MALTTSNSLRVSGLVSGLDTEALVKAMLSSQQSKIDKATQSKMKLEYKGEAQSNVTEMLTTFRDTFLNMQKQATSMMSSLSYKQNKVTLNANSYVNVTAKGSAAKGTYIINSATKATATNVKNTMASDFNANATLTELADSGVLQLESLVDGQGSALLDADGNEMVDANGNVLKGLSFTINGESFVFSENTKFSSVMSAVNESDAGVTMSFSSIGNVLKLESKNTGLAGSSDFSALQDAVDAANVKFNAAQANYYADSTIQSHTTNIENMENTISDYDNTVRDYNNRINSLNKEIKEYDSKVKSYNTTITNLTNANTKIDQQLSNSASLSADRIAELQKKKDNNSKSIAKAEQDLINYKSGDYGNGATRESTIAAKKIEIGTERTNLATYKNTTVNGVTREEDVSNKRTELKEEKAALNDYIKNDTNAAALSKAFSEAKKELGSAEKALSTAQEDYKNRTIDITDGAGNLFAAGGALDASKVVQGANASLNITTENGTYDVENSSNTFTIDGLTFEIKRDMDANAVDEIEFSVEQNVEEPMNRIKEFVNQYNELMSKLDSILDEKTYRDYQPLLDEQRSELKDSQIELWDKKAKSGSLRRDSKLTSLVASLRSTFGTVVDGLTSSQVGIQVAKYSEGGSYGALVLDEDKLTEALTKDPDSVYSLFAKTSTSTNAATKYNESGIISRMAQKVDDYIKYTRNNTTTSNDRKIADYGEEIDKLKKLYKMKEDTLYAKYTAMEKALSSLNSQSSWIGANMMPTK